MIAARDSTKGAKNSWPFSQWTEEMNKQFTDKMTEFIIVALTHMSIKISQYIL